MTSLVSEQPRISLTELAKREGVNCSTIWRWSKRGVAGVRLETMAIGNRRWTTEPAWERWVERVTAAKSGEPQPTRAKRHHVAAERATDEFLRDAGLVKA